MEKKSRILFVLFVLGIVLSVGVSYYKYLVIRDYIVEVQDDCDPATEECFVWKCDPESTVEGEACTGDEDEDIWYFKVSKRNASKVSLCNPEEDEDCEPMKCDLSEEGCEEVLCTEGELETYYATECNDPEIYSEENEDIEDDEEESEEDAGENITEGDDMDQVDSENNDSFEVE